MGEPVSKRSKDFVSELIDYGPSRVQHIYEAAEKLDEMTAEVERAAARAATLAVVGRVRRQVLDSTEAGRNSNDNELMYRLLYQIEKEARDV